MIPTRVNLLFHRDTPEKSLIQPRIAVAWRSNDPSNQSCTLSQITYLWPIPPEFGGNDAILRIGQATDNILRVDLPNGYAPCDRGAVSKSLGSDGFLRMAVEWLMAACADAESLTRDRQG